MKILIIGCNGQLGHEMVSMSRKEGHTVECIDYPDIDITNRTLTESILKEKNPGVVINCAAYTAVDNCEKNTEAAFSINAEGVANIACGAQITGASVVHISTDYVFDGTKTLPYIESDVTNPQSVYGQSKLEGENILTGSMNNYFIFRIAWLYGAHGNNFVKSIRSIAAKKKQEEQPLKVVNDQFGTPTYTKDVCRQILQIIPTGQFGLYHCTSEGICTWYDFACHINKAFNIDADIKPCTTAEFPRPAPRPPYAVLENQRLKSLHSNCMPHWKDSFKTFLEEKKDKEL